MESCAARHVGTVALLTETVVRMGKDEGICGQEDEVDQVREQVDKESSSSVDAPFVLQQA